MYGRKHDWQANFARSDEGITSFTPENKKPILLINIVNVFGMRKVSDRFYDGQSLFRQLQYIQIMPIHW
jgi:hypothetical protein